METLLRGKPKEIRKNIGMTIREVSYYTGISPSTISKYENQPNLTPCRVAVILSDCYNVSIDSINFE